MCSKNVYLYCLKIFFLHICDTLIIDISPLLRVFFFAEKETRYVRVLALN